MNRKKIIGLSVAVMILGLAGIVAYYWYEGEHFVSTEDARIAANLVTISPEISGKLVEWKVKEGDKVRSGDILGRQDLGAGLSTGLINPSSLGNVGGILAEKAALKTPISGEVIRSTAVVGQAASPGLSLAVVADVDALYVSANISETDIGRVRLGQSVDITVDSFPGTIFKGVVETLGQATASTFSLLQSQNSGGNYTKVTQIVPVKIQLVDKKDRNLLVGMNATIRILVK